jgi:sugar phosphate isomerase/epimerase
MICFPFLAKLHSLSNAWGILLLRFFHGDMIMSLSRRRFLGASIGLSTAAMFGMPRLKGADDPSGLIIGIQSYSLRNFPVDEAIRISGELGFKSIEFYSGQFPLDASPEKISDIKQKCATAGLKTFAHGVNRFTKDHEKNRALFQFAKAAGLKNITADPDMESFDSLDKLVAEFDIRVAIHNHGPSHRYNTVVDVLNAVKGHDPRIGACADLGHFIRSGEDPVRVVRSLGDRLYGIHLKDFAEMKDKTKGVILGKGHLDVEGVFRAMKQVNFPADGALSLEYEENPKDPIEDIRQCLAIAQEAAKKVG